MSICCEHLSQTLRPFCKTNRNKRSKYMVVFEEASPVCEIFVFGFLPQGWCVLAGDFCSFVWVVWLFVSFPV